MDSDDEDRLNSSRTKSSPLIDDDDNDDDDDGFSIEQPQALRESELLDTIQQDDQTFLQAAILQSSNEDRYQEELEKVLALSLMESQGLNENIIDTDTVDSSGLDADDLYARGGSSTLTLSDSGPPAMAANHSSERRPSLERLQNNTGQTRPVSMRRPSLERLQDNTGQTRPMSMRRPSLERLQGARNTMFGFDEEEQARELQELIRMGIISPYQVSSKFQTSDNPNVNVIGNVQSGVGNFASPMDSSSRVDNSDDNDNTPVLGAEGPISQSGIRDLIPVSFASDGSLENWTSDRTMPNGESHIALVEISSKCKEYIAIEHDMRESGLQLIFVKRLENKYLLDKFKNEQEHLLRSRPASYNLNCRYLYHGTTADRDRLCEEGLDARLSRMGCFGKGIYFSDTPKKCLQYTSFDGTVSCILVCRVILGDIKIYPEGTSNPNLRREPEKPKKTNGTRFYDSVFGSPIDYNEYVVYENRRVMIEYIISYKADEGATSNTPTASASASATSQKQFLPSTSTIQPNGHSIIHFNMTEDDHMTLIESVRDNVRKNRAQEKGEQWIPPSREQRLAERSKWKNIMQISHAQGMQVVYKKPDNDTASSTDTATSTDTASKTTPLIDLDHEEDNINEVMSCLITDFLNVTNTDDVEKARKIITDNDMDLDQSIGDYYTNLTSE